jgi:hypothetical protein
VKDGAIIYDGDVTNTIKFEDITQPGAPCQVTLKQGSMDSAYYHLLMKMYEDFIKLRLERSQRANEERRAYENYAREELAYHARNSQKKSSNWFGDVVGLFTGGNYLSGLATFVVGEARDFYWHTRVEDTSSSSSFKMDDWFSIKNQTRVVRMSIDGFPLACWKRPDFDTDSVIVACPPSLIPDWDTETSSGEQNCPEDATYEECSDAVDNAPTDDNGYVEDSN